MAFQYFVLYKPYGYLSQFTKEIPSHQTLADLHDFPNEVYPVGRLDKDSEGLLILTNDKRLTDYLLNPQNKHQRTYLAQVEGVLTPSAIQQLQEGVTIKVNKKAYTTLPAKAKSVEVPSLPQRDPPIRYRAAIPTSWLQLTLIEGKNRQVRKMCAKVGFPVLRLVRTQIEELKLRDMKVGEVRTFEKKELFDHDLSSLE